MFDRLMERVVSALSWLGGLVVYAGAALVVSFLEALTWLLMLPVMVLGWLLTKRRKGLVAPRPRGGLLEAESIMFRISARLCEGKLPIEAAAARMGRIERWARTRLQRKQTPQALALGCGRVLALSILRQECNKRRYPFPCVNPK